MFTLLLVYFFIAIGLSFLCSILEAVLLSITASHIEVEKTKNEPLGLLMQKQKDEINISIGAILTLNTFAHTLGAAGVGSEAAKLFGEEYMFYISIVLTILILVLSEIIPKTLGATYWKSLSGPATRIIRILVILTYPLVIAMNKLTQFMNKGNKESISREEVEAVISMAHSTGAIKSDENKIMENLMDLDDIKVQEVLTPRSVLSAVSKKDFLDSFENKGSLEYFNKFKEHSRIPIYNESIDEIIGVVMSKEYFHEYVTNELENKEDLIKDVYTINENIPISKALNLFVSRKEHLFVVTDNYDQTEGVITLEDAIETLLGVEIVDELDKNINLREVAKVKMKLMRKQLMN